MKADKDVDMAIHFGLLTKDYKPNYADCKIVKEAGDWKLLARPYKDSVYGWCTAQIWVKDDGTFYVPCIEISQSAKPYESKKAQEK